LKDLFLQEHSDLFEVNFWHQTQAQIKARTIMDIFPYEQSRRLSPAER
jgi:isocitrate dehydrogenase kinase/phosphatase